MVNENIGWAVGTSGTILYTDNSGEEWQEQTSPSGTIHKDVECIDETTAIIVGYPTIDYDIDMWAGSIIKTENSGETWNYVQYDNTQVLNAIDMVDETGYAVGIDGKVWKTTNGGDEWTALPDVYYADSELTANLNDIFCTDENTCWLALSSENVYYTDDGGSSWEITSTGATTAGLKGVYEVDSNNVWVGGQNSIRYYNGDEWAAQTSDESITELIPTAYIYDFDFATSSLGWAVGHDGKILRLGEPPEEVEDDPTIEVYNPPTELELEETCQDEYLACLQETDQATCDETYEFCDDIDEVLDDYLAEQESVLEAECLEEYSSCVSDANTELQDCLEAAYDSQGELDCQTAYDASIEECSDAYYDCVEGDADDTGSSSDYLLFEYVIQYKAGEEFFEGENVNLYITDDDGKEASFGLYFIKGVVEETEVFDKPTISVYTDLSTLQEIADAESPEKEAIHALKNKDIVVIGEGFAKKLKVLSFNFSLIFAGFFTY